MKKPKKYRNRLLILLTSLTIILVFITITVYINRLKETLSKSTLLTMKELILHDAQTIQENMKASWSELDRILTRIEQKNASNIYELLQNLNREQSVSSFEILYLVDKNGMTYSSFDLITQDTDTPYIQRILSGEDHFAMYYCGDEDEDTFMRRERVAYGIKVDPVRSGNVTIIGLVGLADIQSMDNKLNVDSFEGHGNTGVIDDEGNFIVDMDNTKSLGEKYNIFEMLAEGELLDNEEPDSIREKILEDEFCTIRYIDEDGVEQVMSSIAIPNSDWKILMSVEQSVFDEQSLELITMSTILLVVVVGVFLVLVIIIMNSVLSSAKAEAESEAKGDFLSSMSHEIRTPLNGLIGLIHLMLVNKDNPHKLEDYLEKASSTAQYLLTLVNDILDMQKLSRQSMELEQEPFSLHKLIDTVETLMRSRMESNGLSFEIDSQIANPAIIGDEVRVEQILMNILGNAAKFTSSGGSVSMKVRQLEPEKEKVTTVFEITDTGCGMSEEFQKQVFDLFTQERSKASDGTKGTGLGLSISYRLAKLMGGSLKVKSKLGEGSTFTFELPAGITQQLPEQAEEVETIQDADESRILNILVAEDNDLNAEIVMEIFTDFGYRIQRAKDGQEAVNMFAASEIGEYDVVLMDVQMPVMDGYEAARVIRSMDREDAGKVKIFACTANTFKEDRDKAYDSGMNDFIAKPIDINELLHKLHAESQAKGIEEK